MTTHECTTHHTGSSLSVPPPASAQQQPRRHGPLTRRSRSSAPGMAAPTSPARARPDSDGHAGAELTRVHSRARARVTASPPRTRARARWAPPAQTHKGAHVSAPGLPTAPRRESRPPGTCSPCCCGAGLALSPAATALQLLPGLLSAPPPLVHALRVVYCAFCDCC